MITSAIISVLLSFVEGKKKDNPVFPSNSVERLELRNYLFDTIGNNTIPVKFYPHILSLSLLCYDTESKGYNGIKQEILERLNIGKRKNIDLPLIDFFKHPVNLPDIFDFITGENIEKKTGCGGWLYSRFSDLDMIRKEYEESGDFIKWDYTYKAKNENEFSFSIHIFTDWVHFFRYLDTYDKGYKSFFKYNRQKSLKMGSTEYDMNTLHTSRKKVAFLRNFTEIEIDE